LTVAAASAALFIGLVGPAGARSGGGGLPELKTTGTTFIGSADCSTLTIKVEVTNEGTANAGGFAVGLKWSFNFTTYHRQRGIVRRGLAAGESRTLIFSVPYHADRYMDDVVLVDSRRDVEESDETNNETSDLDVYCFS
jgi:hypothetical protein